MQIEILHDSAVSRHCDGETPYVAAFPLSAVTNTGALVCVYRQGLQKHSYDGIWFSQRSGDAGKSWSAPTVIFDGLKRTPAESVLSGGICQCHDGSLITVFGTIEVTTDAYCFSEEGFKQYKRLYLARSGDDGQTWSAGKLMNRFANAGITSNPVALSNGELLIPMEHGPGEGAAVVALSRSGDNGETLSDFHDCLTDPAGKVNHCDARFAVLPSGDIVALLWTFGRNDEQTIEVHRGVSRDNGQTWSPPEPVGWLGQITAPLAVDDKTLLAVSNYRWPRQGIRLWLSHDAGATWETDKTILIWDAEQERTVAEPVGHDAPPGTSAAVWKSLATFSFGTPHLLRLPDKSFVLTYYATQANVTQVRACRFSITNEHAIH